MTDSHMRLHMKQLYLIMKRNKREKSVFSMEENLYFQKEYFCGRKPPQPPPMDYLEGRSRPRDPYPFLFLNQIVLIFQPVEKVIYVLSRTQSC